MIRASAVDRLLELVAGLDADTEEAFAEAKADATPAELAAALGLHWAGCVLATGMALEEQREQAEWWGQFGDRGGHLTAAAESMAEALAERVGQLELTLLTLEQRAARQVGVS